jgi:putative methyltransferase
MKGSGKIYALDADPRRLETLKNNSKRQGFNQKCIHPLLADFLKLDVGKYSDVEYILLDPSCSGSGIVGRLDNLLPDAEQQPVGDGETADAKDEYAARITALAKFQLDALNHAFKFPNVKKVVYSTCSIHDEENEEVVRRALEMNTEWELERDVLPEWRRRGVAGGWGSGEEMLRCSPKEDYTIGFFAALFVKK